MRNYYLLRKLLCIIYLGNYYAHRKWRYWIHDKIDRQKKGGVCGEGHFSKLPSTVTSYNELSPKP